MENQRNNSGKEQEKLKNQLQNAQEKAKTAAKELKDVKSKEEIMSLLVPTLCRLIIVIRLLTLYNIIII